MNLNAVDSANKQQFATNSAGYKTMAELIRKSHKLRLGGQPRKINVVASISRERGGASHKNN